jgi:hypothetical protein
MQISRIETIRRITALARMILVFRMQSGKYTTEAAGEFLSEILPFGPGRIAGEIVLVSVSPVSAFEGIAIMTAESMLKRATADRAGGRPKEKVRKTLLGSPGMPPYLLMKRMPS